MRRFITLQFQSARSQLSVLLISVIGFCNLDAEFAKAPIQMIVSHVPLGEFENQINGSSKSYE